jgi:hypothetical protein
MLPIILISVGIISLVYGSLILIKKYRGESEASPGGQCLGTLVGVCIVSSMLIWGVLAWLVYSPIKLITDFKKYQPNERWKPIGDFFCGVILSIIAIMTLMIPSLLPMFFSLGISYWIGFNEYGLLAYLALSLVAFLVLLLSWLRIELNSSNTLEDVKNLNSLRLEWFDIIRKLYASIQSYSDWIVAIFSLIVGGIVSYIGTEFLIT